MAQNFSRRRNFKHGFVQRFNPILLMEKYLIPRLTDQVRPPYHRYLLNWEREERSILTAPPVEWRSNLYYSRRLAGDSELNGVVWMSGNKPTVRNENGEVLGYYRQYSIAGLQPGDERDMTMRDFWAFEDVGRNEMR